MPLRIVGHALVRLAALPMIRSPEDLTPSAMPMIDTHSRFGLVDPVASHAWVLAATLGLQLELRFALEQGSTLHVHDVDDW